MDKTDIRARITTKYFKRSLIRQNDCADRVGAVTEVSLAGRAAQDRINRRIRAQFERFRLYLDRLVYPGGQGVQILN